MKECKYSKYCGGCTNLNVEYEEQLKNKTIFVKECFNAQNIKCGELKIIGSFFPYKYRNKVHLAFKDFKGKTIVGFYEEGSSRIVDIESCLLHGEWLKKLIEILKIFIKKYKISPYDNITKTGTIRYAVARVLENKIMLTLVTTTTNFAGREFLYAKLKENFSEVSLYVNVNNRSDKLVFDDKGFKFIKGEKYVQGNLLGVKFNIAPNSFLQVNMDITKKMYSKAIEWLNLQENDNMLDLYSGIGITSILFAKKCKNVVSIEYNDSATNMAKLNKILNNIDNIEVLTGACEKVVSTLDLSKFNKVFLDPARMGAEEKTLKSLIDSNIEKVVYMSCNPETLARDLKLLSTNFDITNIECYDMFPMTNHVETLVCLQRRELRK